MLEPGLSLQVLIDTHARGARDALLHEDWLLVIDHCVQILIFEEHRKDEERRARGPVIVKPIRE